MCLWGARYSDRFVRETAQRIRFLLELSRRSAVPARFLEDLRRALGAERPRDDERPAGA